MMLQIRLNSSYDSDLISIAYGGIFDPTIVFKKAIDAFVRKEPLSFRTVPEHAKLCEPKGSSRINLDFHDVCEEDVINYITIIPDGSRNEVLKHIIRRMISNDFYYALFNFDDYFSPAVCPSAAQRLGTLLMSLSAVLSSRSMRCSVCSPTSRQMKNTLSFLMMMNSNCKGGYYDSKK